jgi:hypothetical protein
MHGNDHTKNVGRKDFLCFQVDELQGPYNKVKYAMGPPKLEFQLR